MQASLDHLAIAVPAVVDVLPLFAGTLGGAILPGGPEAGFRGVQLHYANGMRLELLEPFDTAAHPFLARFLAHHGPGPHHLTFTVPDLAAALHEVAGWGGTPVGVRLGPHLWQEAFLHPRQALGTVVQLAQKGRPDLEWGDHLPPAQHFRPPDPDDAGPPAAVAGIAMAVRALADGERLFGQLLGGEPVGRGHDDQGSFVDLAWPGPGRLRLLEPRPGGAAAQWLGSREGRIWEVALDGVGGLTAGEERTVTAAGTRLRLRGGIMEAPGTPPAPAPPPEP